MAIVPVQHTSNTTLSSTTCAKAYASNVTSGNLLVAQVVCFNASDLTIAVADSRGFTWTPRPHIPIGGGVLDSVQEFISPNIGSTGACTVTATVGGTPTGVSLNISEWSGAQTGTAFDSGNLSNDAFAVGTSVSPASQTVTPSINGCLVLGLSFNLSGNTATAGTGYTLLDNAPTVGTANVYQIQTTATATASAFTITSANWQAHALIIQPFVAATSWGPQLSDQLNRIVQGN